MAGFLEKLKLIGKSKEDDYSEVDLGQFEEVSGSYHFEGGGARKG